MPPQDVAELVPRVRRALEGPLPVSSALTDSQVKAAAADAVADLILLTNGEWGHTLAVTERADDTNYPEEWAVDPGLSPDEESLVAWQAAISSVGVILRDSKVSETIRNEAQEWSWEKSASGMRDWLKFLIDQRDAALRTAALTAPVFARVASILHARDPGAEMIEPWTQRLLVR